MNANGSQDARARPASMREKSSIVLTSLNLEGHGGQTHALRRAVCMSYPKL